MSSGSYTTYFDSWNNSGKTWGGSNGRTTENPYSMTFYKYESIPNDGWAHYEYPDRWVYMGKVYGSGELPSISLAPFANERLGAISELAEALRGHSFDASVFLGEIGQTAGLIADTTRKVLSAYRAVRRRKYEEALRILGASRPRKGPLNYKDPASFWIEIQYGWKPLLNDVFELCKAVRSACDSQQAVYRTRKTSYKEGIVSSYGSHKGQWVNTVSIKAIIREDVSLLSKFGLSSPSSVLWEVTPWSFVVDWFVPVGEFLSDTALLGGVKGKFVTTSFRAAYAKYAFVGRTLYADGFPDWATRRYTGGFVDVSLCDLVRDVTDTLSVPLPSVKALEKAFSRGHLANASALITQQIKLSR